MFPVFWLFGIRLPCHFSVRINSYALKDLERRTTEMTSVQKTHAIEWPYPLRYEQETQINADILVIGGGIAGCHAAIIAARKGAKVAVVDKLS